MEEIIYKPKERLSQTVKFFWYSDGYKPSARVERVLPSGSSQIIINLEEKCFRHFQTSDLNREQKYDKIILAGMQTGHVFLDPFTRISTIGVVLQNGALPALFGIPAGEFLDQVLSLKDLIGSDIPEFREKLIEAPTVKEKFSIAEAFLTRQLKGRAFNLNPAVGAAVSKINISCGRIIIRLPRTQSISFQICVPLIKRTDRMDFSFRCKNFFRSSSSLKFSKSSSESNSTR